jgi:hypothetical protein
MVCQPQINFATGLAFIAAGVVGGLSVLLLSQGIIALKPEPHCIMGLLITLIVMLLFLIPVVIYSNGTASTGAFAVADP